MVRLCNVLCFVLIGANLAIPRLHSGPLSPPMLTIARSPLTWLPAVLALADLALLICSGEYRRPRALAWTLGALLLSLLLILCTFASAGYAYESFREFEDWSEKGLAPSNLGKGDVSELSQ